MPEDGRSRLGRGLAALIGEARGEGVTAKDAVGDPAAAERARNQRRVPIEFLKPNPNNPRRNFSDAELDELTASIRERGIIQPVIVRAGARHRRHVRDHRRRTALARGAARRIARRSGRRRSRRPTARRSSSPSSRTCSAPISMRSKRRPAIRRSPTNIDHSHDDIAKIVGKSRTHVTNTMRLLKLSEPMQGLCPLRQAQRRSRAHADRTAERRRARRGDHRPRTQRPPGRSDGAQERQGAGEGAQAEAQVGKDADTRRAGEACVGCARIAGDRRSSRRGRRSAHPLSRSRSARRCVAASWKAGDATGYWLIPGQLISGQATRRIKYVHSMGRLIAPFPQHKVLVGCGCVSREAWNKNAGDVIGKHLPCNTLRRRLASTRNISAPIAFQVAQFHALICTNCNHPQVDDVSAIDVV